MFNLVNQAALKASVEGLASVSMAALEYAKDKVMMGECSTMSERKNAVVSTVWVLPSTNVSCFITYVLHTLTSALSLLLSAMNLTYCQARSGGRR